MLTILLGTDRPIWSRVIYLHYLVRTHEQPKLDQLTAIQPKEFQRNVAIKVEDFFARCCGDAAEVCGSARRSCQDVAGSFR